MSTNPGNNKAQLTEMVKAVGAVLGVALALFTVVNSIIAQPITSLVVALVAAALVSAWLVLSHWVSITQVITAWLALAVVVFAGFAIWPRRMTVEGLVYDTARNPVTNEEVLCFDRSGRRYETRTNAEGYYQFIDVPSGKYRLRVRTNEIEGETKGILVRVVQQNLTVSEILVAASPTSVAAVTPDTPTVTPTPTNTSTSEPPTSTLTPTPALINATVKAEALNMRGGPGTEYTINITLRQGDVVVVIGQNPEGDWLKVKHEGQTGWVARRHVEVPKEVAIVPVAEVPPTPTSTPFPEPTATHTPTLTDTPTLAPTSTPVFIVVTPTPLPTDTPALPPMPTPIPIIVIIDTMDSISGWGPYEDSKGSSIEIRSTPGKTNNAVEISFSLKEDGWVCIAKSLYPGLLVGTRAIRFSYKGSGAPNTIELKLMYPSNAEGEEAIFSVLRNRITDTSDWTSLEVPYTEFACWPGTGCDAGELLDISTVYKIDFAISNKPAQGDIPGNGAVFLDDVQAVK
jgi:hypothetical protein